jgi:hypothetical protein
MFEGFTIGGLPKRDAHALGGLQGLPLRNELYERGEDATDAEAVLTTLLGTQVMHEMRCIRLRIELLLVE